MFDLMPLNTEIKTILFLVGMIILSLIFYRSSDRLKPKPSWTQYAAGTLLLIYTTAGGVYGFLWPALAGLILAFFLYYPFRLLLMVLVDSIQKNAYDVFNIPDEEFRKLDVDTQVSMLNNRIRYYRKATIRIQTLRGFALMAFIISLVILGLGLLVLRKIEYPDILLLLANMLLFLLLFDIAPRNRGVFFNFLKKYVFSQEIIRVSNHYEQQLQESNSEIKAIEQGYYMTTKKQIMNRLKY
ncbi:hypothetical protein ASZ90_019768 [hydrocarbon metagenome]|uniref:Uncharacterized protein n=1 Tax=hydrocarbon metagenome TaxID=938273 RepID=A0A0W8E3D5_9ZZZZ